MTSHAGAVRLPLWRARLALASVFALLLLAAGAEAQEWTLGLAGGQTVFDPVTADIGTNHLTGSVRYDARRDVWMQGTAAAPLRSNDPWWASLGTGGRVGLARSDGGGFTLGVDLGTHAYLFEDGLVDRRGAGATFEAIPDVHVSAGRTRVQLRAGWRGHALSYAGATTHRSLVESGARLVWGGQLRAGAEARVVHAREGTFPFAGGTFAYHGTPIQAWVHAGRWMADTLDDVTWSVGAAYRVNGRTNIWTSIRQDGRDPLYWNASRRSWSVGMTTGLGRRTGVGLPSVDREGGLVVLRVPVADARGADVRVAGTFTEWQPIPMIREGADWVLRLPLRPGAYRYAFVAADGTWFVPASIPARRDDGMGGEVAVLVVGG